MIASLYDYDTREFQYYRLPSKAQLGLSFGAPTRVPSGYASPIGEAPESLAMPLPDGATYVGSGKVPKGIVCRAHSGALGDVGISISTPTVLVVLGTLAAVWLLGNTAPGAWIRKKVWD